MKPNQIPPIQLPKFHKFPGMPTEGLVWETQNWRTLKGEQPSPSRVQPALANNDAPKPLTHYRLQILTQSGHDQLVLFLQKPFDEKKLPLVTDLFIEPDVKSIEIRTILGSFLEVRTLYLETNEFVNITALLAHPNLTGLSLNKREIYWNPGEKASVINHSRAKHLKINLGNHLYSFNYLSPESYQRLLILFKALFFISLIGMGYTTYNKDSESEKGISLTSLLSTVGSLILWFITAVHEEWKIHDESYERTRKED